MKGNKMFTEEEQQILTRLSKYLHEEGTKEYIHFTNEHFLSGDHVFQGLDTYLEPWHQSCEPDDNEAIFGKCVTCELLPWQVSSLPADFYNFYELTRHEREYLKSERESGDFCKALKHIINCEHSWYEYDSPTLPKCSVCDLRNWDVTHAGALDAIFRCGAMSISARPFMLDEYEDGSLLLEWR